MLHSGPIQRCTSDRKFALKKAITQSGEMVFPWILCFLTGQGNVCLRVKECQELCEGENALQCPAIQ